MVGTRNRVWVMIATLLILTGAGVFVIIIRSVDPDPSGAAGRAGRLIGTPRPEGAAGPGAQPVGPGAGPGAAPVEPSASAPPLCTYRATGEDLAEQRLVPPPPARAAHRGKVRATLKTNLGALSVLLDAGRAPCTVHSFVHLAREDYYTETGCHRLTTAGLWVLQCGDPTGTGTGSPGYRYGEENLPIGQVPPYLRGTLAMANAGTGTNGAQFFIVYRNSDIPPDYTVFGEVVGGIDIVERVAAAGTGSGEPDGRPALEIMLEEITLP